VSGQGARSSRYLRSTLVRLGKRIREFRRGQDRSQEDLAADAELDAKHLQEIEKGMVNPTVATLLGIARALRVPLGELFGGV
jgi:transcriptional regulator with XRE-family HTH domain